ncbi:MAG TPA: glycerophosphodiester phosphodiesterase [Steroidobacteraceae bacterium]|nr:glycerophosphodiester phosphodiesterase [Steroidobacteraceae bacterium]
MTADTAGGAARRALVPIVIGHRGACGYVPEHTLASYFLAIQQGADYIEPDLVSTQDGVLVARHENEIGGTTDVADHPEFADRRTRRSVDGADIEGWFTEDFTLAELKTLRACERIPQLRPANMRFDGQFEIPTLEEILDLVQGAEVVRAHSARARREPPPRRIGVYPETKHPSYFAQMGLALEPPLLAALGRCGYQGRDAPVFVQSFEVGNLERLRQLTDLPLVQLIAARGAPWDLAAAGEARNYEGMITRPGLARVAAYADAIGVEKSMVIPRTPQGTLGFPTTLVEDAHDAGLLVHAWTFRAENEFLPADLRAGTEPSGLGDVAGELARFLAAGLDGLFIDQPPYAVRVRDALLAAP